MEPASPLARKLKLKPGLRAAVIGAPAGYLESLDPPAGVTMIEALDGPLDWVQVFVRTSADLAAIVGAAARRALADGPAPGSPTRRAPRRSRRT